MSPWEMQEHSVMWRTRALMAQDAEKAADNHAAWRASR